MPNDYAIARKARKAQMSEPLVLSQPTLKQPATKAQMTPYYLLNHENNFDRNAHTPEQILDHDPELSRS